MSNTSPGQRLRDALEQERPLQVAGTVSAYAALLAARAGFRSAQHLRRVWSRWETRPPSAFREPRAA